MTKNEQRKLQDEAVSMVEGIKNSYDDDFNPRIRAYLAHIISGGNEFRDFKSNPLSKGELGAIEEINTAANVHDKGDYYVAQMKSFIAAIHENLAEDQKGDISEIMNRVMDNVRSASVANNEKAKKSFQYFQEFLENVNK